MPVVRLKFKSILPRAALAHRHVKVLLLLWHSQLQGVDTLRQAQVAHHQLLFRAFPPQKITVLIREL